MADWVAIVGVWHVKSRCCVQKRLYNMKDPQQYWLVKSEPVTYGIDALRAEKQTAWTGVRNYQARNYMRAMRIGDGVLFYHSNCAVPGVYGLACVVTLAYTDPTQFDAGGHYYEPRATQEAPVWDLVDLAFVSRFAEPVLLTTLRASPKLAGMHILQRGSRLSVTPVTPAEYQEILRLAGA
jgi:predicted RNA-binding protein with PUA-like domain